MTRLRLYKAKLRAAEIETKQWLRHYNRAEKAILRLAMRRLALGKKIAIEEAKQCR